MKRDLQIDGCLNADTKELIAFRIVYRMAHGLERPMPEDKPGAQSQNTIVHWAAVAQNTRGASYLFDVRLCAADTGEKVFEKVREEYKLVAATECKESWVSKMFTKVAVGSAEVQWVHDRAFILRGQNN